MRFFRALFITLITLCFAYIMLALFSPTSYKVERSLTIDAPVNIVWDELIHFRNWQDWDNTCTEDSSSKFSFLGIDGSIGSAILWESKAEGKGELIHLGNEMFRQIDLEYRNYTKSTEALSSIILEEKEGGVLIKWTIEGDSDLPFLARPMTHLMETVIGPDCDQSLKSLNKHVQHIVKLRDSLISLQIQKVTKPKRIYIAKRKVVTFDSLGLFTDTAYEELENHINSNFIQPEGKRSSIYYSWNEADQKTDFAAAIQVLNDSAKLPDDLIYIYLPVKKVVEANYFGSFDNFYQLKDTINKAFLKDSLKYNVVIEEYLTDTDIEGNSKYWNTRVEFLLED